jgi:hypothetical protein
VNTVPAGVTDGGGAVAGSAACNEADDAEDDGEDDRWAGDELHATRTKSRVTRPSTRTL